MSHRAPGRWVGLDALRGLSIAAMILVNNPGRWGKDWRKRPNSDANRITVAIYGVVACWLASLGQILGILITAQGVVLTL